MRTWRFHEFGDLAHLRLEETEPPAPAPGECLVRLEYAALNPADAYLVRGLYPRPGKPPFAVGRDGCGTVEEPCDNGRFRRGDRVVILRSDLGVTRDGTLAEYVCAPEESLAPLPDGWSPAEGAAAPLVFLTAWQALVDAGEVRDTHTVLVTGASGGVGSAAVILAHGFGARVLALSRSPEKRARLEALGASCALDPAAPDFEEQAKRAMNGGRADIVVENLAGPYLQRSLNLLREGGRIAVVGLLAGLKSEIVVGTVIFKRARIEGVSVGAYSAAQSQAAWIEIVRRMQAGGARPLVDRIYAMEEVQEAFARLAEGPLGKVLVRVAG